MATKPPAPSLHDLFIDRPLRTEADTAYANLLDARNAAEARRARVVGRDVGLPGEVVAADPKGFEAEAFNNKTLDMLGSDPALTRFLVDPGNAAATKDDLPSLSEISSTLRISDGVSDPLNNYMRNTRLGIKRPLLSAFGIDQQARDTSLKGLLAHSHPPDLNTTTALTRPHLLDDAYRAASRQLGLPTGFVSDPAVTLDEWLGGTAASVFSNFESSAMGLMEAGADVFKRSPNLTDLVTGNRDTNRGKAVQNSAIYKSLSDQMQRDQAYTQYVSDLNPSWLGKQSFNMAQSAAVMGASVLSKRPLTTMALQQGGQEYQQVRDRGGSANEALAAGTVSGAAEGLFEKYFGLGWMLGNVGKAIEKKAMGSFMSGLLLREVPSEVATTGVQDLADALVTGGEGWSSYVKRHTALDKDNPLIQTAFQTALQVGAMGGPALVAQHLSAERKGMDDVTRAEAGGQFLDTLMGAAEKSKVKKEDPVTLHDFVAQRTQDSPVRNVYVPVEAVAEYMQSDKYGGELDQYKDQVAQAQATQGDVVIPIAEAVAHLSGTPAWEALKDEARVEPGGLSRKEASAKGNEIIAALEQRGKEIATEAEATKGKLDGAAEVYVDVKNRLRVAGVEEKQADNIAQVYAARYETRAARRGGTPMEQLKRSNIVFPGESVDGKQKGRAFAQAFQEVDRAPDGTIKLEFRPTPDAAPIPIKMAIDNGVAEMAIDQFGTGANKLGPAKIREAMHELLRMYPTIKSFGGYRRSGAGKGRVQEITLNQGEDNPRGRTSISTNARIIELFATANRSTLLHETGHIWLEELRDDATADDATSEDKADWATVAKWFKANDVALSKTNFIPTEAHEMWARGVERYFMEGKPPTEGLRGVFHTFRAWLLRIYAVAQNLHSPITPEIREVMSRLLATQEAIDDARRNNVTDPLFKTAEDAGMTDAEFADYQTRVANARDEAYDTLLYKTMEAIRRRKLAEVQEQRASIRAEVTQEVNAQPQYRLLHLLRTGKWLGEPEREAQDVKLNAGWLIDNYGEDILDKLPKGLPLYKANGIGGDEVAEMVGMASGSEVVNTLVGMRAVADQLRANGETRSPRDVTIANEVDRIMTERNGDTFDDGTIEEEAIAALNTARQGEIIAAEARQLAKRKHVLGVPTPYQFAREWAKRTIAAGHVRDVASRGALQRYVRASNKAARLAEEAILKGDIDEAYRQKQAQLLNHALLAEAKAAADRVDAIVAKMRKLSKRAAMKSIDPDYFAKIHMLLENYDFRPRSERSIDEQKDFQEWLERQRAQGFEVHIPPRLENNGDPYTRVSVQELDSLNDLVESLLKLGRMKQKIVTAQKERDFAEFRDEVVAHIRQLPDRKARPARFWKSGKLTKVSPINETSRVIAGAASELLKVETIVEDLDGGPTGPLHDAIVLGATNAENKRFDLRAKVLLPLADTYKKMGRKHWQRLQERVTIPELTWNSLNEGDPRIGQPVTMTRMELLSVLMNMGNLSNLEKLSKGERWPIETLKTVIDREMTKDDYDLAQKMWDQVGLLWPEIVATERHMAGIVPEQVVSAPIATRFGEYAGGYWPVVYDAARWQLAEDLEGKELDDMFGIKSGVATQKGHTVTRTGAYGPIQLSLENVLFRHVEQVVTRIAFSEYARDVLRIVRDKTIRGWIDTKLGPEYRKQVERWLARQIHEGATFAKAARWWEGALRQFRVNSTIAAMGFRFSTGIAQTLGLTASAQRIGSYWVGVGLKRLALSPREMTAFVYARSPEILHRTEAVNREVSEVARKMRGKHGILTDAQHFAMWHIGMMDRYTVALPTWIGAHAKGMKEGMTDEEASAYADKSVRQSQGSGREKDLSAIQSPNSEAMRFWTMFYTPWNVLFNAQWQAARGLKQGNVRPLIAVTWWWLVVGMLGDALLSGDWPKDDKEPWDWAKWAGRNFAFGLFAGIPLARDAANFAEAKVTGQYASDVGTTPITRVADSFEKAYKIGKNKIVKGEDPKRPIKQLGDLSAIMLGVPTSQLGTTGQFAWDVHQGNTHPETISDWYFGITRDKKPKNEEAPQ